MLTKPVCFYSLQQSLWSFLQSFINKKVNKWSSGWLLFKLDNLYIFWCELHNICVGARGQHHLLLHGTGSLCYLSGSGGFSWLCLPSHHRSTVITTVCYLAKLYMHSTGLNSGPPICVASTSATELSLPSLRWLFYAGLWNHNSGSSFNISTIILNSNYLYY